MVRACTQQHVTLATQLQLHTTRRTQACTHARTHTPSTLQCLAAYMLSCSCPLPIHAHTHTHKKCRTTLSRTVRLVLRLRDTVDTMLSGGGSPKRLNETDQEHFTDTGRRDDVQKIFPLSTFRCVAFLSSRLPFHLHTSECLERPCLPRLSLHPQYRTS